MKHLFPDGPKKILIISSWAPPMIGGPQSLYNVFSQFPKDSYSILTSYNIIWDTQKSNVSGSWLPCKYYFFDHKGEINGGSVKILTASKNVNIAKKVFDFFKALPVFNLIVISALLVYSIFSTTKKTITISKQNKFNMLLGLSDIGYALISTYFAHKITKIPYALYIFDVYKGYKFELPYKFLASLFEKVIFKNAKIIIVTNKATEDLYKKRYGDSLNIKIIHNSVFTDAYDKIRVERHITAPYKIIFTGYVYWAQEQSLLNLIKAMEQLIDLPVELLIYSPKPTDAIRNSIVNKNNIKLLSANQSEIPKIQNEATLLFLPLSWNTNAPAIITTATPGKYTDYLASGRPMLVHAPDYAYVSQYTKENQLGLVVDKNDIQLLADTIRNFIKYPGNGQNYVNNALKIFYQNHDAKKNAKKLAKLLEI
ncbi:MAG: glycosyltransferase [Patescibacteria group bacterium]